MLMNICLNLVDVNLASGVKKSDLELDSMNNWDLVKPGFILFLDLENFV